MVTMPKATVVVRMEPETIEKVDALAEREHRTRSQMILLLVREALEAREKGGKRK